MYAFAIVSKDVDFSQLSVLHGTPPKVLWLLIGNCTTAEMEAELRVYRDDILAFDADATAGVLTIG